MSRMESRSPGRVLGRMGCRIRMFRMSGLPQTDPTFVSDFERTCPDSAVDRYRPVLDGSSDPNSLVQTDAGGLWVRLGDALSMHLLDLP